MTTLPIISRAPSLIDQICYTYDQIAKANAAFNKAETLHDQLSTALSHSRENQSKSIFLVNTTSMENQLKNLDLSSETRTRCFLSLNKLKADAEQLEQQYLDTGNSISLLAEALFPNDNNEIEYYLLRLSLR